MASIKINGDTSGSTTISAPATGSDETIELSTALASKLPYSYGTATPSTTDSGFLWYDSNSTPAAPKFWDGAAFTDFPNGLSLIAAESFSAVSTISVNDCFTSVYRNYRVIIEASCTAQVDARFRFRASGSDNSTSNYMHRTVLATSASVSADAASSNDYIKVGELRLQTGIIDLTITKPAQASPKSLVTNCIATNDPSGGAGLVGGGSCSVSSSLDGFTLYPTSGTITGTLKIYGYKD